MIASAAPLVGFQGKRFQPHGYTRVPAQAIPISRAKSTLALLRVIVSRVLATPNHRYACVNGWPDTGRRTGAGQLRSHVIAGIGVESAVPERALPSAKPAAGPPSLPLRNPTPRSTNCLRASRFAGRPRLGGPLGTRFFGLPGRGRCRTCPKPPTLGRPRLHSLSNRPPACAKFVSGLNLLPGDGGLLRG
jgi:hypothetical protein